MSVSHLDLSNMNPGQQLVSRINTPIQLFDDSTGDVVSTYATAAVVAPASKTEVAVTLAGTQANVPSPFFVEGTGNDKTTGRGFFAVERAGLITVQAILTAAAAKNATARVWRWHLRRYKLGGAAYLYPVMVCDLALITSGTTPYLGITNGLYATTMPATNVNALTSPGVQVINTGLGNDIATLVFDPMGAAFIEIEGTLNGGSNRATGFNFLIGRM